MGKDQYSLFRNRKTTSFSIFTFLLTLVLVVSCKSVIDRQENVRPRILRDVPAQNLAYKLQPDVSPPSDLKSDDQADKLASVQNDFINKRKDDALLRTVVSPDGRRVLAVYGAADEPGSSFRIDLYDSEGGFIRNLVPPTISCVFPDTVAWSPDGSFINFIAHKREVSSPSPTPLEDALPAPSPGSSPIPSPSVAPVFAPVAGFNTEQIYICNRDGFDLRPLTSREGLIYFYFQWAPDGHALVALACKEDEWNARERAYKVPAGRPRLIALDGKERLLDDGLTDAVPVWSPDASKIATAFDTDVAIYDAGGKTPTQARLPLGDQLISASVSYEQKMPSKRVEPVKGNNKSAASPTPTPQEAPQSSTPASFNPIVRIEWPSPDRLYFQTAYVRLLPGETINTFQRWHLLGLSAQAAVLK
jgi:hypothetical protein